MTEPDVPASVDAAAARAAGEPAVTLSSLVREVEQVWRRDYGEDAGALLRTKLQALTPAQVADGVGLNGPAAAAEAIRRSEIDAVLETLGPGAVDRLGSAGRDALPQLRARIALAESVGEDLTRPKSMARNAEVLLDEAATFSGRGDSRSALIRAADATDILERAAAMVARSDRIPTLEESVASSLSRIRQEHGSDAARSALARLDSLVFTAQAAVQSRERDAVYRALQALRAERIRLILDAQGAAAPRTLLDRMDGRLSVIHETLRRARDRGSEVAQLDREVNTADDLTRRAADALRHGDLTASLDLASHAAGIVNALLDALATL